MVENEVGEINLIPIKIYEVGSRLSSQFKTHVDHPPAESVEEVVVESLGPYTDPVSTTRKPTISRVGSISSLSFHQKPTTRSQSNSDVSTAFSKISPSKSLNQLTKVAPSKLTPPKFLSKSIESTPSKLTPSSPLDKLIEDLESDSEDNGGYEDIENDPDYLSEELTSSKIEEKGKEKDKKVENKTFDDFEFDKETKKYTCKICNQSWKARSSVRKHLKQDCKTNPKRARTKVNVDLSDSVIDIENNTFKCKVCEKTFKSLQTITAHKRDICNVAPKHECMFCEYKGRNATVLRVHIGKTHGKWATLNKNGTWSYM